MLIGESTVAQDAFKAFLEAQEADTYNFSSMTQTEQNTEMREYTRLKLEAAKEIKNNNKIKADYQAALEKAQADYEAAVSAIRTEYGA